MRNLMMLEALQCVFMNEDGPDGGKWALKLCRIHQANDSNQQLCNAHCRMESADSRCEVSGFRYK